MLKLLIYGMVYLGSALMVCNIYSYNRYAQAVRAHGDWRAERRILSLPLILLILFLLGYLAVGLFGKPDLIVSGILFGGSVYVAIMVWLMHRVTNRIQANEKLEVQLRVAEESSRAKTSFLSNMSHEMRTPLNAVLGLLRLTEDAPELSESTRAHLDQIGASARHLLSLINDVLDMSLIDEGKLELKHERFSFGEIMLQFNAIVGSACQDKGLTYNCERAGNIDEEFIGDAMKLKHILLSVADNAVKFTNAPGQVLCRVEQLDAGRNRRELRFTVRDTGVGMDAEFLSHVFEAFSREDASSTNTHGGSGLGLSLAKCLAEMMGGGVEIQSEKGVGTTVTVTVTLEAAPKETASPESSPASDVKLAGRRILIAEDIDLNAEILADLLDMEGILSERAENGQIAVDRFSASAPGYYDAILMDLRMPVMDGLEATRRIRALKRPDAAKIPILALTANAFEEDVRASLEAGMNVHLPKPADIDLLCATLRGQLQAQTA